MNTQLLIVRIGSGLLGLIALISGGKAIWGGINAHLGEVAAQLDRPDLIRLGAIKRHPDDPARLAADITRLRHEAGFAPRYDLKSAVAAILAAEDQT